MSHNWHGASISPLQEGGGSHHVQKCKTVRGMGNIVRSKVHKEVVGGWVSVPHMVLQLLDMYVSSLELLPEEYASSYPRGLSVNYAIDSTYIK